VLVGDVRTIFLVVVECVAKGDFPLFEAGEFREIRFLGRL
jgi:hypothetical protein